MSSPPAPAPDSPSDYQVAIPSYRRAGALATKTLPLLLARGVPPDRISVFVADDQECDIYAGTLPRRAYGTLVVAAPGMGAVRNFITDHYPAGSLVWCVDDDIDDLAYGVGMTDGRFTGLSPAGDLDSFVVAAFTAMLDRGLTLWGVYPAANHYFLKPNLTTDLRYIVGACWGYQVAHAPHCYVSLDDKEDFERTILHYLHAGGVLRFNHLCVKTRYYTEPGGMQVTRTPERVAASARSLVERFPDLCTLNMSKKSGHVEVRLGDRRPVGVPA